MDDSFANGLIRCPHCTTLPAHQGKMARFTPTLVCSKRNYSGCGVDIAHCVECGKAYQISYKVSEVQRIAKWDRCTKEEQRIRDRKSQLESIKQTRIALDKREAELIQ